MELSGPTLALAVTLAAIAGCGGSSHHRDGLDARPDADASEVADGPFQVSEAPIPGLDPGRVVTHRLNNTEYDNTIRDLLGVEANARGTFVPDEKIDFDNAAEAQSFNDVRYEQYFNAAATLAETVFASPTLRARVFSCVPAAPGDPQCATTSLRAFGLRAWRRPLTDEEVARLVQLVDRELAAGKDFTGAMQTVVRAMLSSAGFLLRVEIDPEPTSLIPHAVAPYELASRLSYWLWSTMPDEALFQLAATGELARPPVLLAQFDRMLDDPRSAAFVEGFAGQWLGKRALLSHQVEPVVFPTFTPELRAAMAQELLRYFEEFLRTPRPFDQFFSADVNFVTAGLARHYGMDTPGLGETPTRVEVTGDQRVGYLGLGGFLTMTSYSNRTDPLTRARWINDMLFCDSQIPRADHVLDFSPEVSMAATFRERAAAIRAMPACVDCHRAFDPLAAGLEQFDAVGRFRTRDTKGDLIDASGILADGRMFADERDLARLLGSDPRFLPCASRKALAYALGRLLGDGDMPHLANIRAAWRGDGLTLRALLKQIVLNDTFRFRRGEVMP